MQKISEKIKTKLRKIVPYEPTEEDDNLTIDTETQMILLQMLWFEIKAKSFGEKFGDFVTDKTREAFKSRRKNPPEEPNVINFKKVY